MRLKKNRLTLNGRKSLTGFLFISPLLIGLVFLFALPLINSFRFSVGEIKPTSGGYGFRFIGFDNYKNIFFEHATFWRSFVTTIKDVALNVPLVLVFSFFVATLLNQKFRGRFLARALFFLPVIISCGVALRLDNQEYVQSYIFHAGSNSGTVMSNMMGGIRLTEYLTSLGIASTLVEYLTNALNAVYKIINASGVQILILISALQTIPESLYEASGIEGATAWESFWKITFPMLSPFILVATVYTIIDSFLMVGNGYYNMTRLIEETVNSSMNYGLAASMAWVYFISVGAFLGIVSLIISRYVAYTD